MIERSEPSKWGNLKCLITNRCLRGRDRYRAVNLSIVLLLVSTIFFASRAEAHPYDPLPSQPGFDGGLILSGSAVGSASPTTADLNGDGKDEIIIGGDDGRVYALDANGRSLWTFDTAAAINALVTRPGKSAINSAPAVADLDGDGKLEVVISVGAPASLTGYNGGMVVLDTTGRLKPGWPQVTMDHIGVNMSNADGYIEGFYSTPAAGDLDGDGDMEIVAGSWDMRIYAWHHDGRLVDGWPKFAYDTVWSSPAMADLDGDGRLEVIIGADAAPPGGGLLYVLRGDASALPGFPKSIDQTVFSSPAVADLNADGSLDIVVGTGNFYAGKGFAVYAWDVRGNLLPGWPVATGGYVLSAPAVGDIDGDGRPEVIVGCNDGRVYAIRGNGRLLPGWPAKAYDNYGAVRSLNFYSPILANFDADPHPEVFINQGCDTIVFDKDGKLLTHVGNAGASGKPSMYVSKAACSGTAPVVSDIDRDGRLEIVRAVGQYDAQQQRLGKALVYVWEANHAPATAPWPMFRRDATHYATYRPGSSYDARVINHTLPSVMVGGESRQVQITLENTGTRSWTAGDAVHLAASPDDTLTPGKRVDLDAGESIAPGQRRTFTFRLQAPVQGGLYLSSWRMADGSGKWFSLAAFKKTKVGLEPSFYVLSKKNTPGPGGVYAGGFASTLALPKDFWNWREVRSFAFTSNHRGYEMLDTQGGVWQGGSAPAVGGHGFVPEAQEILLGRDGTSYYILDRYGKLTRSVAAFDILPAPPSFASPIVRSGALTPDGKGVYLLTADGRVHTGGNAPPFSGVPVLGGDIAKRIKLTPDGKGGYILDAYGRVWNIGAAPRLDPRYPIHSNEDWARDIELTSDGRGYYLLDKEGRIHAGGAARAPTVNLTPVWPGEDVAVDLAVTESSTVNALIANPSTLTALTTPSKQVKFVMKLNSSLDAVMWRAAVDRAWLHLDASGAATPGELVVTVDSSRLPLGAHKAAITITADGVSNSPLIIPVQIHIADHLHTIYLPKISR